ncbi:MucR family transcriptional regulator [Sphingobium boeckii]|uniref:Putative transcriptional regulator n=1 Tax=Sphingobium boeckii TaxID=1082345 RepID=A0A7W9EG27_9SPHN|nr:MucR family transcriptional regulator [Sphingobium boeckii]MBB5686316.1 putative transcriptional regulator [Sphingobium boeckii]
MTISSQESLLALTADIVTAHVAHNAVSVSDLAGMISTVHDALAGLGTPVSVPIAAQTPAVSIKASIRPDYLICLEDGLKLKMLKRHLRETYNMTPEQYRAKWKLPSDYPMVAPTYSEKRRALAVSIGLGTRTVRRNPKVVTKKPPKG